VLLVPQVTFPLLFVVESTQLLGPPLPAVKSSPVVAGVHAIVGYWVAQVESFHGVSGMYFKAEAAVVALFVELQY
jgi:hypothetical protein